MNIDDVRKYFSHFPESNFYKCEISNCFKTIKGNFKHNLKRHIITCHKSTARIENWINDIDSIATPIKKRANELKVYINAAAVKRGCIEMVAIHALPIKCIDYSGFRRILEPLTDALNISISSRTMPNEITELASQMRNLISSKIKDKMICLKMDIASRHNRSILGINCQIVDSGKLTIFSMGMVTLEKRHTAVNIKNEVMLVLNSFGVELWQLYTITVDNGANMCKTVDLLKNDQEMYYLTALNDPLSEDSNEDEDERIDNELHVIDEQVMSLMNCIRCAAHTLQLAANDTIKEENIKTNIDKIRSIVKSLRSANYKDAFLHNCTKIPTIDIVTRWGSTYEMLNNLKTHKEFYKVIFENNLELAFRECDWDFIELFTTAFYPAFITTKELQLASLTSGDFFKSWLNCKLQLTKLAQSNNLAKTLNEKMEYREEKLFNTDQFVAGIFIDPRFNFLLYFINSERTSKSKLNLNVYGVWETIFNKPQYNICQYIFPFVMNLIIYKLSKQRLFSIWY